MPHAMADTVVERKGFSSPKTWNAVGKVDTSNGFKLSNGAEGHADITFDYGRAEGGLPFIEATEVSSSGEPVVIDIIFSETFEGVQSETGTSRRFL